MALRQADDLGRHCPLVQWYWGVYYYELRDWKKALGVFQRLHERCARKLNSEAPIADCWESRKRAEELDNDCRSRMAYCHLHLGNNKKVRWFKKHLKNRRKGRFSIYDAGTIREWVKDIEEAPLNWKAVWSE